MYPERTSVIRNPNIQTESDNSFHSLIVSFIKGLIVLKSFESKTGKTLKVKLVPHLYLNVLFNVEVMHFVATEFNIVNVKGGFIQRVLHKGCFMSVLLHFMFPCM